MDEVSPEENSRNSDKLMAVVPTLQHGGQTMVLRNVDYNIASKLSGFTSVRDEPTKTQYAYNDWGFVSYDDERAICEKTEYTIDNNLNGYIIWEISGDLMPDLSTPLLDATNKRLNEPNVRCDGAAPNVRPPTPLPTNPTPMPPVPVTTPKPSERLTAAPTMRPIQTLTTSPTHHETDTNILPKDEDILFRRGARQHPGNMRLRETVDEFRTIYNQVLEVDKPSISEMIVNFFRNATPPSRFFRWNPTTSRWEELGDKRAQLRVDQMLRQSSLAANTGGVPAEKTSLKAYVETDGGLFHRRTLSQ